MLVFLLLPYCLRRGHQPYMCIHFSLDLHSRTALSLAKGSSIALVLKPRANFEPGMTIWWRQVPSKPVAATDRTEHTVDHDGLS